MKCVKNWEELRETMRKRVRPSWMSGMGTVVYAGECFAALSEQVFGHLMDRRGGLRVVRDLANRSPPEIIKNSFPTKSMGSLSNS